MHQGIEAVTAAPCVLADELSYDKMHYMLNFKTMLERIDDYNVLKTLHHY